MDPNKLKEGVSVKEIENFTKKHRFEVFFCLAFVLACFFSFVFFSSWTVIIATLGAILGVVAPAKLDMMLKTAFAFVFKQEQVVQLVLGVVGLILSIFLPPVIFFVVGVSGDKYLHNTALDLFAQNK